MSKSAKGKTYKRKLSLQVKRENTSIYFVEKYIEKIKSEVYTPFVLCTQRYTESNIPS